MNIKCTPTMAKGQGGILSALLLFAILFRSGLLQEPMYDGEYRRVHDLSVHMHVMPATHQNSTTY